MRLRGELTKQPSSITRNQDTDQDKAPWTAKCTYTQTILLCFACVQHCMGNPAPCTHLTSVSPSHAGFASAAPQAPPAMLCSWAREPHSELRGTSGVLSGEIGHSCASHSLHLLTRPLPVTAFLLGSLLRSRGHLSNALLAHCDDSVLPSVTPPPAIPPHIPPRSGGARGERGAGLAPAAMSTTSRRSGHMEQSF